MKFVRLGPDHYYAKGGDHQIRLATHGSVTQWSLEQTRGSQRPIRIAWFPTFAEAKAALEERLGVEVTGGPT